MKLYIVKAYADERKLNAYADICGYYTSKTALIRAINANREELGNIEITTTNTWLV